MKSRDHEVDWVEVVSGPYAGRRGFVAYEYAEGRWAVRFGTPEEWNGEAIIDAHALQKVTEVS